MAHPKLEELYNLDGKVALITGGSRGLGLSMAEGFILAGAAKVYISSRKADACDQAVAHLNKLAKDNGLSGQAFAIPADVSNKAGADVLLAGFNKLDKDGKLDILIANAGATWADDFDKFPDAAIQKVLDLNIRGVFLTIQAFYPALNKAYKENGAKNGPSRVLITGSVAGINHNTPRAYSYNASKAGVHALGKQLSVDLAPAISTNILAPGFFPSKMTNGLLSKVGDVFTEANPLKRLGEPDDIIGLSIFLASKAGAYVNGAVIPVDGGSVNSSKL
jgi:NAD(P)-dependent dehydrogenase (short-subunit alcohol dehydrogenase family)